MDRPTQSRMRWQIVFMAFLGTAINYVDRANLGVAMPTLKHDFGISSESQGLILGAFFWTYAACQLPSGWRCATVPLTPEASTVVPLEPTP